MKKYLAAIALAAAFAVGVTATALSSGESSPVAADPGSVESVVPDVATLHGDEVRDDVALGDQGEAEDIPPAEQLPQLEVEEDFLAPAPEVSRESVLADIRDFVEARAEGFGEALVDLSRRRADGSDVTAGVADLADEITVFGESVITGVAITPDTVAAVPDLRELHQGLISGIDDIQALVATLDPLAGDELWSAGVSSVLDGLGSIVDVLGDAV